MYLREGVYEAERVKCLFLRGSNMKDIERNISALNLLKEGEFSAAQTLFIENMKLAPSYQTYNNLGCFFLEFGRDRSDGKAVRAEKIGFRYLKKSLELCPNILAYRNLAYFGYELYYYENGSLEEVEKYQKEVLKLQCDNNDIYNYAVVLYELGKYDMGLDLLDKIVRSYSEAAFLYLLCLKKLSKLSLDAVDDYQEMIENLELFSKQYIYYHCKDYARVVSITESFHSFGLAVDEESLAVYTDSLLKLSRASEIKNHIDEICEKIEVERQDFIDLLNNEHKRKAYINRYDPKPTMEAVCGFYGCAMHNTAW